MTPTPSLLQVTSSVQATPTPSPQPTNCSREENAGTIIGFFDWPETAVGEVEMSACPHGPDGGVAMRECGTGGVWEEVDVVQCNTASPTVQVLLDIAQVSGGHVAGLPTLIILRPSYTGQYCHWQHLPATMLPSKCCTVTCRRQVLPRNGPVGGSVLIGSSCLQHATPQQLIIHQATCCEPLIYYDF